MFMKKDAIGDPLSRVDGRLKVTGGAKYSGEYKVARFTMAYWYCNHNQPVQ
jgi:xanthine dehydrogenase YagR molybdenum-binding subunit